LLAVVRVFVENKKQGGYMKKQREKDSKGRYGKSRMVYTHEDNATNDGTVRYTFPDYMTENLMQSNGADAFVAKFDLSLLGQWRSLDNLVVPETVSMPTNYYEEQTEEEEGEEGADTPNPVHNEANLAADMVKVTLDAVLDDVSKNADSADSAPADSAPAVVSEVLADVLDNLAPNVVSEVLADVLDNLAPNVVSEVLTAVLDNVVNTATQASATSIVSELLDDVVNSATLPPPSAPPSPSPPPTALQKLLALSAPHSDIPLSLKLKLDIPARIDAVEKVLIHVVARLTPGEDDAPAVAALKSATKVIADVTDAGAYVDGADDLLSSISLLTSLSSSTSLPPAPSPRLHHDPSSSSFASLRKLNTIQCAALKVLDTPSSSPDGVLSLMKLARKQSNLKAASSLVSSFQHTHPADAELPPFLYESANLTTSLLLRSKKYDGAKRSAPIVSLLEIGAADSTDEHFKVRSYMRAAKWLSAVENRDLNRGWRPPSIDLTFDTPIRDIVGSFDGVHPLADKVLAPGDIPHDKHRPNRYLAGHILKQAVLVAPTAKKPLLRLGDWSYEMWVSISRSTLAPAPPSSSPSPSHALAVSSYCDFLKLFTTPPPAPTIALRLLKLVAYRPADCDTDHLLSTLKETPADCWTDVIPQLLSLTGHEDSFARNVAVDILSKTSSGSKEAVAATSRIASSIVHSLGSTNCSDEKRASLTTLKNDIATRCDAVFDEITALQKELDRLSNLWDERWTVLVKKVHDRCHAILSDLYRQVGGDLGLDDLNFNSALGNKKLAGATDSVKQMGAFMLREKLRCRVVVCIKDLILLSCDTLPKSKVEEMHAFAKEYWPANCPVTGCEPETPNEEEFQASFSQDIVNVVKFLSCSDEESTYELSKLRATFHELFHVRLSKRLLASGVSANQRTSSDVRKLSSVCPGLNSAMESSSSRFFTLPTSKGVVKVTSCHHSVEILESKTNPKKVTFYDEFNVKHNYLLKGSEDMRVDERMMQLLNVTNKLLSFDKRASNKRLSVRTYAVLPTSERSGLIEWVEGGVQSLCGIYEARQQRLNDRDAVVQQVMHAQRTALAAAAGKAAPAPMSEALHTENLRSMFFKEVGEVMRARDPSKQVSGPFKRKELPSDVLVDVYENLKRAVQRDLVETELMAASDGASIFYDKQTSFARSMAASSVLGWFMGLGDRHPNNLLVDFESGEIVHIDYGVIFDSGKGLIIPETVPFRLTQSMVAACGITGVEGVFRNSMESTLDVLRKNKELLLTMLEAFIHDPVVGRGYTGMKKREFAPMGAGVRPSSTPSANAISAGLQVMADANK